MLKKQHLVSILFLIVFVVSCTSPKNTAGTRWYHSFNTRYNVYFNGEEAYKKALKSQQEGYAENYSEMIYMFPVKAKDKDKPTTGGPFDGAIEKAVKAIKTHSIKTRPEKQTGKRNDPKYKEFMSREEYNPFLYKAWMLMGKSQFYNADFLEAASSFSYIARHYASQPEIVIPAKLWQARSYTEMEWFYEAEDVLSKIDHSHLTKKESEMFATTYSDYLIKQKQYKESIPYLQIAAKAEKGRQRARLNYLLGQVYAKTDQNSLAYNAFGDVIKSNPPYALEFSAQIRQTEVYPGGSSQKVIKDLKKMAKSQKNKDYLDQVYYAMGNVYMSIPDTAKAIESYELGVEKSTKKGLDKAFCQIKLGDIYFQQRKYVKAQPCYSEALSQLKKENTDYERVSKRSEALDELVIHYQAVQLQDSLQRLSKMSESERMAVVTKIIETLKKEEEEAKKKAARENFIAEQEAKLQEQATKAGRPAGPPAGVVTAPQGGLAGQGESFYFYNEQAVMSGKSAFQQKWGRRKLEDDWRRRNKVNPMSDQVDQDQTAQTTTAEADSTAVASGDTTTVKKTNSSDIHDPQFYLQQIPVTAEDIEASNLIIIDGLFNMGMIYKDKLEDYDLSIESFDKLNTRFPDNENKLESYYNLYLIYLRQDNKAMAELYKSKIREEFSKSDYAIAMADPNYEYNIRMMDVVQDSIYQQTYQAYINGNVSVIRKNYETANSKYSQSKLMPKFLFLNALSYVMTQEPDTFKVRLKSLIDKYPKADVSILAGEMMKGFQKGLSLASGDGNLSKGGLFNIRLGGSGSESSAADSVLAFSVEKNTPYMLMLIYPKENTNENKLLFIVATYNFGNFMVADFDLQFETFGSVGMLQVKGFNNYNEVIQYWKMVNQPAGYAHLVENSVVMVPISLENYKILTKGKSLEEYSKFFEDSFGKENATLIEKWKDKQQSEVKELSNEEQNIVVPEDLQEKTKEEIKQEIKEEQIENPVNPVKLDQDTVFVNQLQDSIPTTNQKDSLSNKSKFTVDDEGTNAVVAKENEEVLDAANQMVEKASETMDKTKNSINEISSDPIRGIQNLFKKKKSNPIDEYAKQQEQQEKERQKELKKQKEGDDKAAKVQAADKEKERQRQVKDQETEEKTLLAKKKQQEEELTKIKQAEQKQKDSDKKHLLQEREDARKLKEKQYKAQQAQKEKDRKAKEKAYKEEQKKKAKAREEAKKQKEEERKALLKQKEEERKKKTGSK